MISRNLVAFITAFILSVLLCLYWLYIDMQKVLHSPMNIQSTAHLNIAPGMSLSSVTSLMVREGWISNPYYLNLEARRKNLAGSIKAGEYSLEPGITQSGLLDKLVSGKVIEYALTFPEGLSFRQMLTIIQGNEHLIKTLPVSAVSDLVRHLDFLQSHPEGRFYPDTYHFPRGTTDLDILRRSYLLMERVLAEEWQNRLPGLPYDTPYQALIMASIIEKETADPSERDQIAGVFVRRLQRKMRLQTDPTVIYAMGEDFDGNIRRKDLYIDSPYNTYVYSGLPPTPIAAPGRDSIRAALQPAGGEELYFVSKGDGTHQFSRTLEEHNQAVRLYQLNRRQRAE